MKAGRELDARVAEKVMGWTNIRPADDKMRDPSTQEWWEDVWGDAPAADGNPHCIPHYSTDIGAAWQVVTRCLEGWWIGFEVYQYFQGVRVRMIAHPFSHPEPQDIVALVDPRDVGGDVRAEDPRVAAYAICMAALKAVGS